MGSGDFERLAELTPQPILVLDEGGTVALASPALCRAIGMPAERIIGRALSELAGGPAEELARTLRLCARSRGQIPAALRLPSPDGGVRRMRFRASLLRARTPAAPASLIFISTDLVRGASEFAALNERVLSLNHELRERTRTVRILGEAAQRAENASRAKTEFLANMSHEVRTPLTSILGFAELLVDAEPAGEAPSERAEALLAIQRNGLHLLQLLNDLLDLAKIEAGALSVEGCEFSPRRLLEELTSGMRGEAVRRGIALALDCEDSLPERIVSDPTRIRQILFNLISNALKFTRAGEVRVTGRTCAANARHIELAVADTGIGIAQHDLGRLFEAFQQADPSTTRTFGGTGLGLTICRRLTELLGARLEVESRLGQGSRFSLVLPVEPAGVLESGANRAASPRRAASPQAPMQLAGGGQLEGRVLLAEDGVDNRRVLGTMLRKSGADVTLAENGQEAVDLALEAWRKREPFDLILMDLQMPVLDGYAATRALRAAEYPHPIVALTAHSMLEERERCLRAGCDDFAGKPIARDQLVDLVRRYLRPEDAR